MLDTTTNRSHTRKPELLIPASSLEVLKTAVIFGADAVYIGGEAFSLRAKAKNFSLLDMQEGIRFAHSRGVKVYVTANILAHNDDLEEARQYFSELRDLYSDSEYSAKPDALIISDPGMFMIAKEVWPEVEIHISTQANNTNYQTYLFWHRMGAKRVVSARELSLEEIRGIRERIPDDLEIETFVHGAMCISYSGRCLLSNYFTGRDANQGACTHPCRWKYAVMEEKRPGEYLPVYENERGSFIFNSKDLCMIEHIPDLVKAGIDSFKIEGRMKTALYVAAVTRTYRKAIDDYFTGEETYLANLDWYREEISKCTYRQFSTGFFYGKPSEQNQIYDNNTYVNEYTYLGIIEEGMAILSDFTEDYQNGENKEWLDKQLEQGMLRWDDMSAYAAAEEDAAEEITACEAGTDASAGCAGDSSEDGQVSDSRRLMGMLFLSKITQRNKFSVGDYIEVMKPSGENLRVRVAAMYNGELQPVTSAPHAQETIWVWLMDDENQTEVIAAEGDLLRVKE